MTLEYAKTKFYRKIAPAHQRVVAATASVLVAFGIRIPFERWPDYIPLIVILLPFAIMIKGRIYSVLEPAKFLTQDRKSTRWIRVLSISAMASLAWGGLSLVVNRFTYSERLPTSVWLIDFGIYSIFLLLIHWDKPAITARNSSPGLAKDVGTFAFFLIVASLFAWKTFGYPMTYDDLNLVRYFSMQELLNSFQGDWTTDRIQTAGYRPLTTLFNHARYVLFREDVVAHRMFLLVLYAGFLTSISNLARRLGLPKTWALMGGLLVLTARHNVYHFAWLSDGIHILQALLIALALSQVHKSIDRQDNVYLTYSLIFLCLALLVREDSLIAVPVLMVAPHFIARISGKGQLNRRSFHRFAAASGLLGLALLILRGRLVDSAQAAGTDISGWSRVVKLTLNGYIGQQGFDLFSDWLVAAWPYVLVIVLLVYVLGASRVDSAAASFWLLGFLISCSVGLSNDRPNLLLLSTTFFALFMVTALSWVAEKSQISRIAVSLMLLVVIFGASYISNVAMEAFHPYASNVVHWNAEFLLGRFSDMAKIPEQRRLRTTERLNHLGIYSAANFPRDYYAAFQDVALNDRFSQLVRRALSDDVRRPVNAVPFFVPLFEPFSP